VNANQIIAAEIADSSPDFGNLEPMVAATERELEATGINELPDVVVADPGYWHAEQMEGIVSRGIDRFQREDDPQSDLRRLAAATHNLLKLHTHRAATAGA